MVLLLSAAVLVCASVSCVCPEPSALRVRAAARKRIRVGARHFRMARLGRGVIACNSCLSGGMQAQDHECSLAVRASLPDLAHSAPGCLNPQPKSLCTWRVGGRTVDDIHPA